MNLAPRDVKRRVLSVSGEALLILPTVQDDAYGRIVRIPLADQDRRIFTPIPHASPSEKRGYRRRSALEQNLSRVDNDFGFERQFLLGRSRVTARFGLTLTVMMALALAQARAGRRECMRSLAGEAARQYRIASVSPQRCDHDRSNRVVGDAKGFLQS